MGKALEGFTFRRMMHFLCFVDQVVICIFKALKTTVMTRKGESGRVEKINTISEDIEDSDFHRTKDIVANIP